MEDILWDPKKIFLKDNFSAVIIFTFKNKNI